MNHLASFVTQRAGWVLAVVAVVTAVSAAQIVDVHTGELRIAFDGAMLSYFLYKREHELWIADDPVLELFRLRDHAAEFGLDRGDPVERARALQLAGGRTGGHEFAVEALHLDPEHGKLLPDVRQRLLAVLRKRRQGDKRGEEDSGDTDHRCGAPQLVPPTVITVTARRFCS